MDTIMLLSSNSKWQLFAYFVKICNILYVNVMDDS